MAKKTRCTYTYSIPKACRVLSFIAVLLMGLGIAVAIVLGFIPGAASVGNWIKNIAIAIGLIGLCWISYYEARMHGQTWFILWIIAVILVIVCYVLGMTPLMPWNK